MLCPADARCRFRCRFDRDARPERSNLLALYADLTGTTVDAACTRFQSQSTAAFKADLTDAVIDTVTPIGDEIRRLQTDPAYLDAVMLAGAREARAIAADTLADVRAAVGLAAPA